MPLGDLSLDNKIALVTGGGSGISLSWVKLAVEQGSRVLIADLRLVPEAEAFVQECGPSKVIFVKTDSSKRAELENLITVSKKEFGDVPDVYICGAAVFEPKWSNFWDDTEEDDYAAMSINVNGPLKLSRIAVRALLGANKTGVILLITSLAGYQGAFSAPLYCATKHAIVGFVRSMAALDDMESIKVVAVAPGMVNTPMWTAHPALMKQYAYDPTTAVSPLAVARAMLELCTSSAHPGGTCLEVSIGGTRSLGTWNVAAPEAQGTGIDLRAEVVENYLAPVRAVLDRERDRGWEEGMEKGKGKRDSGVNVDGEGVDEVRV